MTQASSARMYFSWSRRSKSIKEQVIAVTCFPAGFKGQGSAAPRQRKRAAHRLRGSSLYTVVPPPAWCLRYWNGRKAQTHNCLMFPILKTRSRVSGDHSLLDGGAYHRVSGLLSLQHDPANNPSIASTPSLLLSHKHCFCPLPSLSHIIPYIHTAPSLSVHLPT